MTISCVKCACFIFLAMLFLETMESGRCLEAEMLHKQWQVAVWIKSAVSLHCSLPGGHGAFGASVLLIVFCLQLDSLTFPCVALLFSQAVVALVASASGQYFSPMALMLLLFWPSVHKSPYYSYVQFSGEATGTHMRITPSFSYFLPLACSFCIRVCN